MNVVGIVQTDLNEFSILFEDDQQQKGKHGPKQQNGQNGQSDSDDSEDLFSFLTNDSPQDQDGQSQGQGQNQQGQQGQQGQQNLQEMTVRIKGIPEGQKATFLQMYQVIQDAKELKDLEQNLTIVNQGNGQQNQNQGNSGLQQ